eukprot:jgi/Orpsp1_1/1183177/evm.model.c7180000084189.2
MVQVLVFMFYKKIVLLKVSLELLSLVIQMVLLKITNQMLYMIVLLVLISLPRMVIS